MRRGIGVARLQQQQQTQQQMAELGAQITAERVGQIADQMETLEQQLRVLAAKHKDDIKHDPLVRARFRQLADSLGVDLISSKKNLFAGALGLGDFYYSLASKVVEVCMRERKFCGSYVPLAKVVHELQRLYAAQDAARSAAKAAVASETGGKAKIMKKTTISDEDVSVALRKLDCLGAGYNVVTIARVKYVQTTPDGANGADEIPLLNFVVEQQREKVGAAKQAAKASASRQSSNTTTTNTATRAPEHGPRLGAAYVLGAHPLATPEGGEAAMDAVPLDAQCVSLRQRELMSGLGWPAHRVHAIVQRMVQDGSVWIDYPDGPPTAAVTATPKTQRTKKSSKTDAAVSDGDEAAVYWFVSLTTSDEAAV